MLPGHGRGRDRAPGRGRVGRRKGERRREKKSPSSDDRVALHGALLLAAKPRVNGMRSSPPMATMRGGGRRRRAPASSSGGDPVKFWPRERLPFSVVEEAFRDFRRGRSRFGTEAVEEKVDAGKRNRGWERRNRRRKSLLLGQSASLRIGPRLAAAAAAAAPGGEIERKGRDATVLISK